ncbi:Arm DNA-binding domain-containing protein [Flavobacterium procerum]|uniref:Arm DNA-binding domain-containing protein n=1 Tax=Flavobacterium procerum TaxID=1455569 RepID=A0ABV6BW10_9FLAO
MLENSFGLAFFLKTAHKGSKIRAVHLRITVDGITKETSTKRKWDFTRWDQKTERALGSKEDAKSLNFFLDSLTIKINETKTEIMYSGKPGSVASGIQIRKKSETRKIMQPIYRMI